ncbi:DUF177 domain-containing protein [Erythrobacter arachoides]|uniref:DUF177 domain-containing protein n=1 Tax=Aurantiacibacter arachoides TaxID=1850444 RepID=A0A845A588_9SPHN|nr:YceD family protein [Aurantiacibacter arachoides]MXO94097.1 DUF177 domain-containing protein [Aurantiacibacter arachoides]GGD66090.1 metal-binding protein [Aurantiacibacter arachoides]
MSEAPEFSRMVDLRSIGNAPVDLVASESECAALAARFGLVSIERLEARVDLLPDGAVVEASGTLIADFVQSCAVSGEDLSMSINEPFTVRFVPAGDEPGVPDQEIELDEDELDEVFYDGTALDLGEAVAQSLALAIDPFATGPTADDARRAHGLIEEGSAGPLAEALKGLKLS